MKKIVLISLFLASFSLVSVAQFSETMKEKVRDPLIAEYLTKSFEYQYNLKKYNQPIPPDFPSLKTF